MKQLTLILCPILFLLGCTHHQDLEEPVQVKGPNLLSISEEAMSNLKKDYPQHSFLVATDALFPTFVLDGWENLLLFTPPLLKPNVSVSRPTVLVVIHDTSPVKAMYASLDHLDEVQKKYGMHQLPENNGLDIYWAELRPPSK